MRSVIKVSWLRPTASVSSLPDFTELAQRGKSAVDLRQGALGVRDMPFLFGMLSKVLITLRHIGHQDGAVVAPVTLDFSADQSRSELVGAMLGVSSHSVVSPGQAAGAFT